VALSLRASVQLTEVQQQLARTQAPQGVGAACFAGPLFADLGKMVQPLVKRKKQVKRKKHFDRHQCDRKMAVKPSWRRPKGIDGRVRRCAPLAAAAAAVMPGRRQQLLDAQQAFRAVCAEHLVSVMHRRIAECSPTARGVLLWAELHDEQTEGLVHGWLEWLLKEASIMLGCTYFWHMLSCDCCRHVLSLVMYLLVTLLLWLLLCCGCCLSQEVQGRHPNAQRWLRNKQEGQACAAQRFQEGERHCSECCWPSCTDQ
jgi:large subunit ribosomal protein L32e